MWRDRNFDHREKAVQTLGTLEKVREDCLTKYSLQDPPNPAQGYYVNVYLVEKNESILPWNGSAVHTDPYGLPYVSLGVDHSCCDSPVVYHEGFHIFQWAGCKMTPGFVYGGNSRGRVHFIFFFGLQ